jgi:hypothetical protein
MSRSVSNDFGVLLLKVVQCAYIPLGRFLQQFGPQLNEKVRMKCELSTESIES